MIFDLSEEQIALIKESLRHTKHEFEEYATYPHYEFKRIQIAKVDAVMTALKVKYD